MAPIPPNGPVNGNWAKWLAGIATSGVLAALVSCATQNPPNQPGAQFAFDLVTFTGLDHEKIEVNPTEVVAIREPRTHRRELPPAAKCALVTTDGKFISVLETCSEVSTRLENSK